MTLVRADGRNAILQNRGNEAHLVIQWADIPEVVEALQKIYEAWPPKKETAK